MREYTATSRSGGPTLAVNAFFNRETRDDLTAAEQSYLHDSFKYTGGGLVLTAITARALFKSGFAFRVMSANPWLVLGVSLVGSIGTMMGAMYTSPENTVLKHTFWLVSDVSSSVLPCADRVSGLQRMPSSDAQPVVLRCACYPLPCSSLHLRCGWSFILRRRDGKVSTSCMLLP